MFFSMRYIFFILILFISYSSFSQDFQWVKQISGDNKDFTNFIEIDNLNNNYSLGVTESRIFDIDHSPNNIQIIDNTNTWGSPLREIYLIKTDENRNFIWGRTYSIRKSGDEVYGLKIGNDGFVYILAMVSEFDSSSNVIYGYVSIIKVDPNGNEISRFKFRNLNSWQTGTLHVNSFDIDSIGNFYITGYFTNNVSLVLSNPNFDLNANGIGSYIIKVDNSGNIIWKKTFDYLASRDEMINLGNDGNPYLLINTVDTNNQNTQRLFKIDFTNGNTIWEKEFEFQIPELFHISNNGNLIIGSSWNKEIGENIDVDPSNNTFLLNGNGYNNRYFLNLNSDGDFIQVKEFRGNGSFGANMIIPRRIASDNYNNYYIVGEFGGTVDFDPSINSHSLTAESTQLGEGFYLKFDVNLNFITAFKMGKLTPQTNPYHNCYGFVFNDIKIKDNEIYFVGEFQRWADFDLSNNVVSFNSTSGGTIYKDGFILKLSNCDTTIPLGNSIQTFCSSLNPTIANLTPNSGIIKWYDSQTSTSQLQNTQALINGQTYYASKQVGNCPESTDRLPVTVSIVQSPSAPNLTNQDFCESENATLSSLNIVGQNLTWYDSNNNILPNNTILINNETYYVSQTINNCESDKTSFTAIVNPNALPTLTSPQQFCIQENATLNNIAISGQNIQWYDAVTGGNLLPNTTPLQNAITYYSSQTINGCESTRVPVLISIQNTSAPSGNQNQSFCSTENATLNNIAITGTDIIWYDSLTGNTILPTSTLLQNGVTYYASQTVNGCESQTRLAVSIQLINTLNANNYSETICDDLNNGFETTTLSNYNSLLISSTGNIFKYYNSLNGAQNQLTSDEVQNSSNYNLSLGNKLFYVRIESPNTCFQIVTLNLTLVSKPFININDVMPICEGSSITIDAGFGYDNYTWSTNETSSSIIVTQPGNYSVTASENHGTLVCSTTKNFTVVNSNIGTISEIITSDWTQDENTISVLLSSNSAGIYEYSLNGIDFQDNNTFYGLENGEYTVFIRDKNGCGISSEDVYLLMYPKYFTPNGDGYNDYWRIKFSENEPNLLVTIFDRYGKLITQFYSNSNGWDGTYNDKELPSTDYWFVVKRENGKEHKGHFSLKR